MKEPSISVRRNAIEAQKKDHGKSVTRNAPPPNTPEEDEDERVHLLGVIKGEITACRVGIPLSPDEQEELLADLERLKLKYQSWKALEAIPSTTIPAMKKGCTISMQQQKT